MADERVNDVIRRSGLLLACLVLALVCSMPGPIRVNAQTCGVGGGTASNSVGSAGDFGAMGTSSSVAYEAAQQFQIAAGVITQITFRLDANVGSPSGTLSWEITTNNAGEPGTVLQSGTITPTQSAVNTITLGGTVSLSAATSYWLRLYPTSAQANNTYWVWRRGGNTYADGVEADRAASTWTQKADKDLDFSVTTSPPACTNTPTPTATFTPTNTPTDTPTFTPTFTDTPGPTPTAPTPTPTPTDTHTPTITLTPSTTPTPTITPLVTNTPDLYGIVTLVHTVNGTPVGGRPGAIVYTVTIGESVIIAQLFTMLAVLIFGMFFVLKSARK